MGVGRFAAYLVKRLVQAALVTVGITVVIFFVLRLTGDPASLVLPLDATPEQIQATRHAMGVDQPVYVQFERFIGGAVHGDFGRSLVSGRPAMHDVLERFPKTAYLAGVAMVLATLWAVPAGILSAAREGGVADMSTLLLSLLGQSMPVFWVGIVMINVFGVGLRWFPVGGSDQPSSVAMPAVSLAILFGSSLVRQVRSGMVEVLHADYVRTARSKGVAESRVLVRHALRNAMLPVVTVIGLQVGTLLGGAVLTETVFSWPGLGRLIVNAIGNRDFPVVEAGVFLIAVLFVVTVVLTDILYTVLDPRLSFARRRA